MDQPPRRQLRACGSTLHSLLDAGSKLPISPRRPGPRHPLNIKKKPTKSRLGPRGRRPSGRRTSSAAGVEEQEGLRAEHLLLGGAADVRVAEVVPLVGARFGVEVAVAHIGGVVPA